MPVRLLGWWLCAMAVASCGQGDGTRTQAPRVSVEVARQLPTHQYALAEAACPEALHLPRREAAEIRARGRRQLRALVTAYRRNPDALIRTSFTPADEPGLGYEDLTIGELARTHLDAAEELQETSEGLGRTCSEALVRTLRDLTADR